MYLKEGEGEWGRGRGSEKEREEGEDRHIGNECVGESETVFELLLMRMGI